MTGYVMHGLFNRALQRFVQDTYGADVWDDIARSADLGLVCFEALLVYDDDLTEAVLRAGSKRLDKSREALLEDMGTYLVSHPKVTAPRRLLRFGGEDYVAFLHSLDDLPDRARLAVPDLDLPQMRVREGRDGRYLVHCRCRFAGEGLVLLGILRGMADDYGALASFDVQPAAWGLGGFADPDAALERGDLDGAAPGAPGVGLVIEVDIHLLDYAAGRTFALAEQA
ncbi:heme NO-binding protein [Mesobaculum littorinae]|uniref:Heme NO-binding protein n=1 Tax=Mesobaculum littorinae TaxID=2486419 RepID=A0A438AJ51_9RHOB|nr:heme NO-binding domain-containing protein [Mesobaculum littorinae]RVV98811.1 heme NO-binding protein [Mesobaculum littorinae]